MKEQFASYEEALELKRKGFNEPCLGYFFRGDLHYDRAPYVYDGRDYFEKLGFQSVSQIIEKYDDVCLAPLKQQLYAFANGTQISSNNKIVSCEKGDSIIINVK